MQDDWKDMATEVPKKRHIGSKFIGTNFCMLGGMDRGLEYDRESVRIQSSS